MTQPVNLYAICGAVSQAFRVSRADIKGPAKDRFTVRARFASAFVMRSMRRDIDRDRLSVMLGNRDYSTCRHAVLKGGELYRVDPEFKALCLEAQQIASSWRVGTPLPGFVDVEATEPAPVEEKPPAIKIRAPRPIDQTVTRGYQCADDYASPLWYKLNNDNAVIGLTIGLKVEAGE